MKPISLNRTHLGVVVGVVLLTAMRLPAGEPRVDRFGDPLPDGAIARYGTHRFRQGWMCYACEFSPDGKWIACASAGQGVCIWEVKTGERVMRFLDDTHSYSLSFSD